MNLRERLIARIAAQGPMTIADYMTACLHDPDGGYYATRPGLGAAGDFITAPHVSQMFGELIGLWVADVWMRLGSPARFMLVELGPGDGTLLSDMLRALRLAPACLAAADIWLVETSMPLRARQSAALAGRSATWVADWAALPADAPIIILANEFLDCLPIRQWVSDGQAITERRVGLNDAGALVFIPGGEGEVIETSQALVSLAEAIGARLDNHAGAALLIDYGRDTPGVGDTLQALRGHHKESVLTHPGQADLTAHVDFPAFIKAAGGPWNLTHQGAFLRTLGLEARAQTLMTSRPDRAEVIARQRDRLIAPDQMGTLFKVASRVSTAGLGIGE